MLEKYFDKTIISDNLTDYKVFKPLSDRDYWEKMRCVIGDFLEKQAVYYDTVTFEPLYASLYLEFFTKQNRTNFEEKYFERRKALATYALLEAFYNDGRYMEKILDLSWMILEESTWALPTHVRARFTTKADALPWYKEGSLAIFSSETASLFSLVYTLFKDKFDEISVNISKRIEDTVWDKIIKEYLYYDDYVWMGFYSGADIDNWNPWVNSNILVATLTFVKDPMLKTDIIYKVMTSLDRYLNLYPLDGACDEGAVYWAHAGLLALECFNYIKNSTNGKIDPFSDEKTKNMSEYISKVYISGNRFVNFADCASYVNYTENCGMLYKYGKILNSNEMMSTAKELCGSLDTVKNDRYSHYLFNVRRVIALGEYYDEARNYSGSYKFKRDIYFESIGVMISRQSNIADKGLFLAAKGGCNAENHNHNDVGNFMVYKDGEPFIIDSGALAYNALTFDPEKRYTIWTNISEYHNLPKIGGRNQIEGGEYKAENVKYECSDDSVTFSLDIANAYKHNSGIKYWQRTFNFNRKNAEIKVFEKYELETEESITLNYLSPVPFAVSDGCLTLKSATGTTLKIIIDLSFFDFSVDEIETDEVMRKSWNDKLYRGKLTLKTKSNKGCIEYTVK